MIDLLSALLLAQWLGWIGLILSIPIFVRNNGLLIPLLGVLRLVVVDGMVVLVHGNDGSGVCSERLHTSEAHERIKGVKNLRGCEKHLIVNDSLQTRYASLNDIPGDIFQQ